MIVLGIRNRHANKTVLHFVPDMQEAVALAKRLGVNHPPENAHMAPYVTALANQLQSPFTDAVCTVVPSWMDWHDIAKKTFTPQTTGVHQEAPVLLKSQSSGEDILVRDRVSNQIGAETQNCDAYDIIFDDLLNNKTAMRHIPGASLAQHVKMSHPLAKQWDVTDLDSLCEPFRMHPTHDGFTEVSVVNHKNSVLNLPDPYISYLLSAYKEDANSPLSNLLKYAISRIHLVNEYEGPSKVKQLDSQFVRSGMRNGTNGQLLHIKKCLSTNTKLIEDLLHNRRQIGDLILQFGQKTIKMINGSPHVALCRSLQSPTHGEDNVLSSWSDVVRDGIHSFCYWIPLTSIWHHYAVDGAYKSVDTNGEILVDKFHDRIPAHDSDVMHLLPEGVQSAGNAVSLHKVAHGFATGATAHLAPDDIVQSLQEYFSPWNADIKDMFFKSRRHAIEALNSPSVPPDVVDAIIDPTRASHNQPDYSEIPWRRMRPEQVVNWVDRAVEVLAYGSLSNFMTAAKNVASVIDIDPSQIQDRHVSKLIPPLVRVYTQLVGDNTGIYSHQAMANAALILIRNLHKLRPTVADEALRQSGFSPEEIDQHEITFTPPYGRFDRLHSKINGKVE